MKRQSTRRTFIATLGTATTLSLAGCSAILGPSDTRNGDTQTNSPSTTDSSETNTTQNKKTGTPKQQDQNNAPFSRGTVLEDFKKVSDWRALGDGKVTLDRKNPYQGKQSMVLLAGNKSKKKPTQTKTNTTNSTNTTNTTNTTTTSTTTETTNATSTTVGVARSYYSSSDKSKSVDLRNHDLSMAVRFEKPADGRIGVELYAPSESISLTSRRYVPIELNGWTRIDLGYTGEENNPNLKNILGIRILVSSEGSPINVAIDDIRKIPKAKKGKVMFQFDDGHITTHTEAFPRLKQRGWPAGAAIIPEEIGTPKNMMWANLRELGSAGWDMMSHPPVAEPLPTFSAKKQEKMIDITKRELERKGFKDGARHIVAPYGRVSNKTIEIMKKYHEANYMFGGSPANAKHPSNMYGIPRVHGTSPDAVNNILDLAEKYKQMVVIAYHDIGTGSDTSVSAEGFEKVLNHVEQKDMDVVSPSQFLDSVKK